MSDKRHACFGISLKWWLSRRRFFWLPRMGPKYILVPRDKTRNLRVNDRPYSAWTFIWLCFDVVLYLPKLEGGK